MAVAVMLTMGGLRPAMAAEPSPTCVQTGRPDARTATFDNRCAQEVSVAYCYTDRAPGKRCGDQGSGHNPYYTFMFSLKPGDGRRLPAQDGLRYAICPGRMDGWGGLKGQFESSPDGGFVCWPDPPKADTAPKAPKGELHTVTATGRDLTATCAHAQAPLLDAGATPPLCHCQPLGTTGNAAKIYRCAVEVQSGSLPPSVQDLFRAWIKQQSSQPCDARDTSACERSRSVSVGGIRG